MIDTNTINNPMVQLSLQGTIELLKDYIASEPLGKAMIQFQKKNPGLSKWDPISQEYEIWKVVCKKAAETIMEEIHQQVNGNFSLLDDAVVDRAIAKVLNEANKKVKINYNDALFFTLTEKPLPPGHPLSSGQSNNIEKFNLFGINKIIPENN
jgi:hypothetical protein